MTPMHNPDLAERVTNTRHHLAALLADLPADDGRAAVAEAATLARRHLADALAYLRERDGTAARAEIQAAIEDMRRLLALFYDLEAAPECSKSVQSMPGF
jgi:inorganic triphosphatase YgiF